MSEWIIQQISEKALRTTAGRDDFARGEYHWREKRVLGVDQTDYRDRVRLTGVVTVPSERHYPVDLSVRVSYGRLKFTGKCPCWRPVPCEHMVAVILAGLPGARPALEENSGPLLEPLASGLNEWLDRLTRAVDIDGEDYPATVQQRILYVLTSRRRGSEVARPLVTPTTVRLLKDGTISPTMRTFSPRAAFQDNAPKYLRPSDRRIMRHLLRFKEFYNHGIPLEDAAGLLRPAPPEA